MLVDSLKSRSKVVNSRMPSCRVWELAKWQCECLNCCVPFGRHNVFTSYPFHFAELLILAIPRTAGDCDWPSVSGLVGLESAWFGLVSFWPGFPSTMSTFVWIYIGEHLLHVCYWVIPVCFSYMALIPCILLWLWLWFRFAFPFPFPFRFRFWFRFQWLLVLMTAFRFCIFLHLHLFDAVSMTSCGSDS